MKIIGNFIGNVECKRFYMPGIKAFSLCPKCKEERGLDFNDHYLSYPVVNRFQPLYFYCEPCDENWEEEAMLKVSLKGEEMDKQQTNLLSIARAAAQFLKHHTSHPYTGNCISDHYPDEKCGCGYNEMVEAIDQYHKDNQNDTQGINSSAQ